MIVQQKGQSFIVAKSCHTAFWKKFNDGIWEPESIDFLNTFIKEDSLFLDIGCFIGPLTLYSASKGARVFSLDPDPLAYEGLLENIALNPRLAIKVTTANVAISNANGKQKLYARTTYGSSSSSLVSRVRDQITDTVVSVSRLDSYFEQNGLNQVDVLKVDIEGGEYRIIDQLVKLKAAKKYNNLMLSLHYDQLNEAIYQKEIRLKVCSLILMKLERIAGAFLFKKQLLKTLETVNPLFKEFRYVYNNKGHRLSSSDYNPNYLLQNKVDLFFSDKEWSYSSDEAKKTN